MNRCRRRKVIKWLLTFGVTACMSVVFWPSLRFLKGAGTYPSPQQRRMQGAADSSYRSKNALHISEIFVNSSVNFGVTSFILPQNNSSEKRQEQAEFEALVMKDQSIELTDQQEELIKNIDPERLIKSKKNIFDIRKQHDQMYYKQLRKKGQIEASPTGGERVIAYPNLPVRFPTTLKNIRPENWEGVYRIYQNLTYFPWPKQRSCERFSTVFTPLGSLKTMALASFPSSGNSWIRYLIEGGCGIFTGSMYDDVSLTRRGMYGEGVIFDSGMTLVQKTHGYTTGDTMKLPHSQRVNQNHMNELNNRGIIVIRNPFKALISHRHLDVGGHTGFAPRSHFIGEDWKSFIRLKITLWQEFYIDWLSASKPQNLHIVFFEHLQANPMLVLKKILKFLNQPIDNQRLYCLSKYSEGQFKRKSSKTLPLDIDPYTSDLKELVYEAINAVNEALTQRGKKLLPVQLYDMYSEKEAKEIKMNELRYR